MKFFITGLMLCFALVATARELVQYEATDIEGHKRTISAVLRVPKAGANGKALVILHHAGGWGHGTTTEYGDYFSERGFVTLEPRMFSGHPYRVTTYMGDVFGALKYLSEHPVVDKTQVSVMGLSYGANMAIIAATEWANKTFTDGSIRFKSHAPFYPVCWGHIASIKRSPTARYRVPQVPEDFEDKWIGSPMRIFYGTNDDYDWRDPTTCQEFVDAIPDATQRSLTSLVQYEGATHGWDQLTRTFFEPAACKGRGCLNSNVNNPSVTAQAKEDLLKFLSE